MRIVSLQIGLINLRFVLLSRATLPDIMRFALSGWLLPFNTTYLGWVPGFLDWCLRWAWYRSIGGRWLLWRLSDKLRISVIFRPCTHRSYGVAVIFYSDYTGQITSPTQYKYGSNQTPYDILSCPHHTDKVVVVIDFKSSYHDDYCLILWHPLVVCYFSACDVDCWSCSIFVVDCVYTLTDDKLQQIFLDE